MKTSSDYLDMQRKQYNTKGKTWGDKTIDHFPVGKYKEHNEWEDYDTELFKSFGTNGTVALEYGCGPGRNIVKFKDRFKRIDGVDISEVLIEKAIKHVNIDNGIISNLEVCDGQSIPFADESYDVVFSVICLQHIPVFEIRDSIVKDVYRVLKPNGYFCFQMGFGGKDRQPTADYYDNVCDAKGTNGQYDVTVRDYMEVKNHMEDVGFKNFNYSIRDTGPLCKHKNWIWVEVQK